jgi:hypothetical protein
MNGDFAGREVCASLEAGTFAGRLRDLRLLPAGLRKHARSGIDR